MARPKQKDAPRSANGRINKAEQQRIEYEERCAIHNAKYGKIARHNIPEREWALGRCFDDQKITGKQFNAANKLTRLYYRLKDVDGRDNLDAIGIDLSRIGGIGCKAEPDPQYVMQVRAEYNSAVSALRHGLQISQDQAASISHDIATHKYFDDSDLFTVSKLCKALTILQKHFEM